MRSSIDTRLELQSANKFLRLTMNDNKTPYGVNAYELPDKP